VPGDDAEIGVDEYRDVEAEGSDASSDLRDLFFGVRSGVAWVRLQQSIGW